MVHSIHFSNNELACPHCHLNNCKQPLVDMLEKLREAFGKPILINSAYRCPAHNKAVGGAPNSQHVLGLAADIRVEGLDSKELERIARTVDLVKGLGRDDFQHFIHVDARIVPAEWCYNVQGQQIPYYA